MLKFIDNNDFTNRSVALFGTSGSGVGAEVEFMKKLISDKNGRIVDSFFCVGQFWFTNKGRPIADDLTNAKNFAETLK